MSPKSKSIRKARPRPVRVADGERGHVSRTTAEIDAFHAAQRAAVLARLRAKAEQGRPS